MTDQPIETEVQPDTHSVGLTFKVHKGYDSPLINFRATDPETIKRDLAIIFGLNYDPADVSYTVFQMLADAHEQALAVYSASDVLRGTIQTEAPTYGNKGYAKKKTEEAKPTEEQTNPHGELLRQINAVTSTQEIDALWKKHRTGPPSSPTKGWPTEEHLLAVRARVEELKAS